MKIKRTIIISLLVLSTIVSVYWLTGESTALAADNRMQSYLDVTRQESGYEAVTDTNNLPAAVTNVIAYALSLVGVIFLILIIVAGFQWMTAGGNEEKISQAKKRLINSTIGLGITLAAFVISYAIFKFFFEQTMQTPYGGVEPPPGNQAIIACDGDADCRRQSTRRICDLSAGNCVECLSDTDCPPSRSFCHPTWKACMLPEGTNCNQINDPSLCQSNGCKWIVTGYSDGGTWATGQCVESSHSCPQCNSNVPVCVEIDNPPPGSENNTFGCVECVLNVARGDCSPIQTCTPGNYCLP